MLHLCCSLIDHFYPAVITWIGVETGDITVLVLVTSPSRTTNPCSAVDLKPVRELCTKVCTVTGDLTDPLLYTQGQRSADGNVRFKDDGIKYWILFSFPSFSCQQSVWPVSSWDRVPFPISFSPSHILKINRFYVNVILLLMTRSWIWFALLWSSASSSGPAPCSLVQFWLFFSSVCASHPRGLAVHFEFRESTLKGSCMWLMLPFDCSLSIRCVVDLQGDIARGWHRPPLKCV